MKRNWLIFFVVLFCLSTSIYGRAKFGVSAGYTLSSVVSDINIPKDSIEYIIEVDGEFEKQKVLPDYSEFGSLGSPMGFFLRFAIHDIARGKYSTDFTFSFAKKPYVQLTTFDWTISRDFNILRKRLIIPVGLGLAFGSVKPSISYAQEIHSAVSDFEFAVKESEANEQVSASSAGVLAYTGIRLKLIRKLSIYAHVGYRISTLMDSWEGSYPTWKWDDEADEGEGDWVEHDESFDVPKEYLGAVPFLGNEYSSEKKYQNIFNFYVKWKKLSSNYHKPHGKKILI